jgi:hypothetical protein
MTHTQQTSPHRTIFGQAMILLCLAALANPSSRQLLAQSAPPNTSQQLTIAGLRSAANQGEFNAVVTNAAGDLYLVLNQGDGIRILETDASASTVLAQAHLGATGDEGLAMAIDPSGNLYVTGTTTSSTLTATAGTAFPARSGTTTNSFVAKFDASLDPIFVTFTGSTETVAQSIAATADAVFITGSLFNASVPVTPAGIFQAPAFGSTQNGFVERFSYDGSTLVYATYLTGATGNTVPAAIVADSSDDAYIAGTTSASGYPTIAALVPQILTTATQSNSGFLTKLNPAGSGITFSTFLPGAGVTSLALDAVSGNLLLSGNLALGQFPVATAPTPLVATPYQSMARIALDGSAVLSSTIVAPGSSSFVIPSTGGTAWVDGTLTLPLLPLTPLASLGTGFAAHLTAPGGQTQTGQASLGIDQTARFGGLPSANPTFTSLTLNLAALAADSSGNPIFVGAAAPSASASLLATATFDLPLVNAPTAALPSSIHDAVPAPVSCAGSLCPGSAAYFAKLSTTPAPSLALSIDTAPVVTLRNLGSVEASGIVPTATGFTLTTTCGSTLPAGGECSLLLTGPGPGTLTIQAVNATTQTAAIPALSAASTGLVFSPAELDFGIQTSTSPAATRTVTITNLGTQPQSFLSVLASTSIPASTVTEDSSNCPLSGTPSSTGSMKLLVAGASCQITLALTASSTASNDGIINAQWTLGSQSVLLTGYSQAASLNVSAPEIDFGLQFAGGLHPPRFVYLSNNSTTAVAHTPVVLPTGSPFTVTDLCPSTLDPATICQLALTYQAAKTTSSDALTLALGSNPGADDGISVLVTGETLPQPGVNGTTANPSLTLSPTVIAFANAVPVTSLSTETHAVTITNTGTTAFSLALSLTGDFTQATNCTSTLAGGASCTTILNFAPSQPGTRQGLLAVTAGAGTSPAYVTLSGTATPILAVNNGTLSFGGVPLGEPSVQWIKITEPFSQLTAASTKRDFTVYLVEDIGFGHGQPAPNAFTSTASGSCSNCWLGVQFTPSTLGAETATLTLASTTSGNPYTVALTGTGLPSTGILLTPLAQDFGPVSVNSTSAPALFTLTNQTSAAVTVSTPALTGDFALTSTATGGAPCTGTLAVGASCFAEIAFAPSAEGPRTGTLTIATTSGSATASLTGFGNPDPGLALSPSALVFENVPGTTSAAQIITLKNTGTGPLQIGSPTVATTSFTATTSCSTLAPGSVCTLTVSFLPTNATVTDTLSIPVTSTLGGSTSQTTYTVPLSGAYTTEDSGLQILPNQTSYGPSPMGALGLTRQFTLNNLTQDALSVQLALPRQFVLVDSAAPCRGLAASASCTFNVAFLPLTNGDITGTLFAQANPTAGGSTLDGLGFVEGYGLGTGTLAITGNLSGQVLNFGQVASGQTVIQILTLTNTGGGANPTAPVTVRRITSEWPFLSTSTCGTTLAVNQSCTVTLSYTPLNQIASGTLSPINTSDSGTLVLESDAISSPDEIDLTGSGAPASVSSPLNTARLSAFTPTQGSLTFAGITAVGDLSQPQTVDLANTGTAVLHIFGVQTTPDFSVQNACSTLLPGSSCTLTVYFNPQQSGIRFSALDITSDSSTSLEFISLLGTANPSTVSLTPNTLSFGSLPVGSSATLPLQVTNNGSVSTLFNSITATGDYTTAGTCPAPGQPLAANTSCTVQVTFKPSAVDLRNGTLSIATNSSTLPLTAPLTGIGVQSQLQIIPAALSFGSILVEAQASLNLTLSNPGTAPVTNLSLTIAGDYTLTAPCAVSSLAPGATCTVTIAFKPTALGSRPGTLTVTSSDPASPVKIPLTGTGIANGSFTLAVNTSSSASAAVLSGDPATYTLTVTPQNDFSGTVVLNCSAIAPAEYATCSLLPSSITLAGTAQNTVVTLNTITSVAPTTAALTRTHRALTTLCLLVPGLLLLCGPRRRSRIRLFLWIVFAASFFTAAQGCGSGNGPDPYLRFAPSGAYQYEVSASSTSGVQLTQSVTLNLTIK